jgi:hypothetical protein
MGPTHNDRQTNPPASSQPGLFDDVETNGRPNEVKNRVSAEPNASLGEPLNGLYGQRVGAVPGPVLVAPPPSEPIWLKRIKLVIFVLFCIELGMLLTVLPWTKVWTENGILLSYPALREVLRYDFVRGAISGLGLIDIWLGIREAVNYREK